jgi:branched-chain amino acid transport system permease protein
MNSTILALLARDALTTGAIYALIAIAFVLVFAVTRVLFIPQGEFVAFAALSMVAFEEGRIPGAAGLLLLLAGVALISRLISARRDLSLRLGARIVVVEIVAPVAMWGLVAVVAPMKPGPLISAGLTLTIMVMIGMTIYRAVFQPMEKASVLVLMIAAFGVHFALLGLGLYFFGPEGFRTQPFADFSWSVGGGVSLKLQDAIVLLSSMALMLALWWFFARTVVGKALRASAVNRVGASLVGISTARTGQIAFALAAGIGAISGVLIGPVTTIYFDTGFVIGLKGLIAAVLGGLVSFPLTVAAALGVAAIESLAAFWASSYKEAIVFFLTLPVLLALSLAAPQGPEDELE